MSDSDYEFDFDYAPDVSDYAFDFDYAWKKLSVAQVQHSRSSCRLCRCLPLQWPAKVIRRVLACVRQHQVQDIAFH